MDVTPLSIRDSLGKYARTSKALLDAFKAGDPQALRWIQRYHSRLPGRADTNDRNRLTEAEIRAAKLRLVDARAIVARAHQFESWPKLAKHLDALRRKGSVVRQFEMAVEAIVSGDAASLEKLLRANPKLIRMRSTREHHAKLLHYVGANAVESYRQKTPRNAVEIARILLAAGAEVDADLDYRGAMRRRYPERFGSTTLGMVATSCHPAEAGVQIALLETLLDAGASVDGIPGKWNPLLAALHNGRGHAAEFLAECGAKMDLEGAAGVGRLEVVESFFRKDGRTKPNATREQAELGFAWACEYGHVRVVGYLLKRGVPVDVQPHGETGLHWAAYGGHADIVQLLLNHGAPVEVKDKRFDGTPLGWALYGWCNPPPEANRPGYYESVARLVAAGASVAPEWLADPDRGSPIGAKAAADPRMRAALRGTIPPIERTKPKKRR